jgi:thymidine kinase
VLKRERMPQERSRGGNRMAKLYFKYGSMSAGKSLELLKTADSYERQGKRVMVCTPSIANRDGEGIVSSRIGLQRRALILYPDYWGRAFNVAKFADQRPDIVLIDEAQFLSEKEVVTLTRIVDELHIPVIAFGLKNTFDNKLFAGTAALLAHSDAIEEIKAVCSKCGKKATMNLRKIDGVPTIEGSTVQIGDEEYEALCRPCFKAALKTY